MVKGTGVGANVRISAEVEKGIVFELKNSSDRPLSTSDLSAKLDRAWHTIERACLMLQIAGRVDGFRVGKMNLWRLK